MKRYLKFVSVVLLLSMATIITPPRHTDGDPAPTCDPQIENCKPPLPPLA